MPSSALKKNAGLSAMPAAHGIVSHAGAVRGPMPSGAAIGREPGGSFFFNDTATTEIYTLSLHDALPISEDGIRDATVTGVRKSTRLNSSHGSISYAVFCLDRKSTRLNSSHGSISYAVTGVDRKSTRLNSSHGSISDAGFCLDNTKVDTPADSIYGLISTSDLLCVCFFFFNDTATTEIYTLSLHDALPIYSSHGSISYAVTGVDRKSTCLNSSHDSISYAVSLDPKSTTHTSTHARISS